MLYVFIVTDLCISTSSFDNNPSSFFLWKLPVVRISPELVTSPGQGKSSAGAVNFSLWTVVFWDGIFSSSSSSSYICQGVGPLVDPFWSHVSRSLFKDLPWFLLPVGEKCFITLGNPLRGTLFTCCIHFLLYSSNLSKICVIFNCFAICVFVL